MVGARATVPATHAPVKCRRLRAVMTRRGNGSVISAGRIVNGTGNGHCRAVVIPHGAAVMSDYISGRLAPVIVVAAVVVTVPAVVVVFMAIAVLPVALNVSAT